MFKGLAEPTFRVGPTITVKAGVRNLYTVAVEGMKITSDQRKNVKKSVDGCRRGRSMKSAHKGQVYHGIQIGRSDQSKH